MVTIKQIAQEVGISPSTVSIVLSGKGEERKISAQTQKRILEAAAALGYQPNIAARSLRGGGGADELQIAMFWAQDFRASMMVRFWDGLRSALEGLRQRRVRLVIYPYNNDHLSECRALTSASDCHAAIICNASYKDLQFLEDTQLAIPVVLYNRMCPGYCSVNVDDAAMGALAARAMISQGCTTASILTGTPVFEGMEVRTQGFALEGSRYGMEVLSTTYCENSMRGGYEMARRRLTTSWKKDLPQAVFCGSAMIAHGLIRALWESGLPRESWPKLVSVGNGNEDQDELSVPSLSVVRLPMEKMAEECLHLLLELMDGKITQPVSRMLEVSYVARETCGDSTHTTVHQGTGAENIPAPQLPPETEK